LTWTANPGLDSTHAARGGFDDHIDFALPHEALAIFIEQSATHS
jgi:hypothetical protein